MQGFIEWTKGQIEVFAEIFRKQVFSSDADQQTINEALKIAHSQSRKVGSFIVSCQVIYHSVSSSKSLASIFVTFSMIFLSRTPRGHSALRRRRSQRTSSFRPQHLAPERPSRRLPRLQPHLPPIQLRHAYEHQWRTVGQRQLSRVHFHVRSLQQEWQRLCLPDRATGREAGCGRHPLWCRHEKGCFELWVGEVYIVLSTWEIHIVSLVLLHVVNLIIDRCRRVQPFDLLCCDP